MCLIPDDEIIKEMAKEIQSLQSQLKLAEEVIDHFANNLNYDVAKEYFKNKEAN